MLVFNGVKVVVLIVITVAGEKTASHWIYASSTEQDILKNNKSFFLKIPQEFS